MEKLELKFSREKETKNCIRYQEQLGEVAYSKKDVAVGSLYIMKECLGKPAPQRLIVTIQEDTNGKK